MQSRDKRQQLLDALERLRQTCPPEQYGAASARILYELQKLAENKRKYAKM